MSYRSAGSSTDRCAQPSRVATCASRSATSTSVKSRVEAPAQVDSRRASAFAVSSTRPVGWSCRSRSPDDDPTKVLTSWCSANPNSSRPAARDRSNASPSAGANVASTLGEVLAGSSSQSAAAGTPDSKGRASSAGPAALAASSAARTTDSTSAAVTLLRDTTADAVPSAPSTVATTVSARPRMAPLVVSVLPAQRTFTSLDSRAITTQPSACDSDSARSTSSCGLPVTDPPPARC